MPILASRSTVVLLLGSLAVACGGEATGDPSASADTRATNALSAETCAPEVIGFYATGASDIALSPAGDTLTWTTSAGGIDQCAAYACANGGPTVIAKAGTYSTEGPADDGSGPRLAVGPDAYYVLDVRPDQQVVRLTDRTSEGKTTVLAAYARSEHGETCGGSALGASGNVAYFDLSCSNESAPVVTLKSVDNLSSGPEVLSIPQGSDAGGATVRTAFSGTVEYLAQNTVPTNGPANPSNSTISELSLVTAGAPQTFLAASNVKIDALQVTTDFAAWQGTPYAGAGTTHTYACGGSATCKPVALPSLDGYTLAGAYLGTLFLVDASSDVYTVQSSDLLAGTPEPVLLARGLPAFTKFVGSSSTTFYVLTSSGRIERTYPAGCGS